MAPAVAKGLVVGQRCVMYTPIATRVAFLIFTLLASASFPEVHKMFDETYTCDKWDGSVCKAARAPVRFCVPGTSSVSTSGDSDMGTTSVDYHGGLHCMDGTMVALIIPVSSVLSIIVLIGYTVLEAGMRLKKFACKGLDGRLGHGLLAGLGIATTFALFQSFWAFFLIASLADYFNKVERPFGVGRSSV